MRSGGRLKLASRPTGIFDSAMAAATYDSSVRTFSEDLNLPDSGLRLLIDEAKRAAKVTREVSLSDVAELSILRVAQREMGIK